MRLQNIFLYTIILIFTHSLLAMQPVGQYPKDPLYVAIDNNDIENVNLLLAAGANPNQLMPIYGFGRVQRRELPLVQAVQKGNVEIVRALIQAGADTALKDSSGFTALDAVRKAEEDVKSVRRLFGNTDESYTPSEAQQEIILLLENPKKEKIG